MSRRLLHANLKNDVPAIEEVHRLLADLREAWVAIGDSRALTPPSSRRSPRRRATVRARPSAMAARPPSSAPCRDWSGNRSRPK
jgi:hypothetical protein